MKRSLQALLYRLSLILIIFSLLFSACNPKTATPTQAPPGPTQVPPTPTPQDSGLPVVDDGSPIPPEVIEQQPRGGQELAPNGEIVLTFNQPMDAGQTAAAWEMVDQAGKAVDGAINWSTPHTMHFKPAKTLANSSTYRAKLSSQAASSRGVNLPDSLEFEFTTVGELQVTQVFPQNGAVGVASNAVITVIFNRPVVPLVILEEQDKLPNPLQITPELSGKGEWVNTSMYAFHADKTLKGSTTYSVVVKAGLSDAGNETQLTQDYTWSFTTTAPSIANFELSGVYGYGVVNPDNYLKNVLLGAYFTIRFYQPMDPASSQAAFALTSQGGGSVPVQFLWNDDLTQVVITPTQRLALDTQYSLQLSTRALAADGGALQEGLDWQFSSVPPPAILGTFPENGTTQGNYGGDFRIQFASPMNIESVKDKIVITPKPTEEVQWWYNDWDWSIVGYFLKPSTSYEIRLLPGMQDIYGNAIGEGKVVRFKTAAYQPSANLQMPYETPIYRAGQPTEFYAQYLNIKTLQLKLYRLDRDTFAGLLSGKQSTSDYIPDEASLIWQVAERSSGTLDQQVMNKYEMKLDGEPLPVGFYFLGLDSPDVQHYGSWVENRLFVVANANLTLKTDSTHALAWLTDLNSGKPLENTQVVILDAAMEPIGLGLTDSMGLLSADVPTPVDPYEYRFALVDDRGVFAFTSTQWGSGISMWDYGIWGSYYAPPNQPTAYVYTERPIYRPGQPVYFKGIVRLDDDLAYSLPDASSVRVKISNYEETIYDEELSLNENGSFSSQLTLDSEAALGAYFIEVSLPGSDTIIGSVNFNVAEYRKPEFQVLVSAQPTDVLAGQSSTFQVQADYYSGGGVSNAEVAWTLSASPFFFQPPDDLSAYTFTDYDEEFYRYYQETSSGSEMIAQGTGRTDASGRFTISLPADLSDSKTSRSFVFEATVTDLSQSAVSGRVSIVGHRSKIYPGIRPSTYIGIAGDEAGFDVVALDWDGKPLPGQKVSVEIVERRWYSVQEQDANGRVTWTSSVEEIPVTSFEDVVVDDQGKASVKFTPPNGGIFRARVSAVDNAGNPSSASTFMWVAGAEFIPWRQTNDHSFDLVTDRKSYSPGDTAEILIASPFEGEAYALVTVERGRIHYQDVVKLTSNSMIYKLPIQADMAPNVYVSVILIKGVDEKNPRPNFKMGIVEIGVDTQQQALKIELTPDRTQAGPGEMVQYTVRTLDYNGKPVSAEVSLSLSDLATLSLMPPNSAPILDFFYSKRILGVWTSVPLALSIEEYNADIQEKMAAGIGGGSGGAKGVGELGVVEVRQNFPDTAYWDAQVITGPNGQATVAVKLPDNLTTWRMEARAFTPGRMQVGQTTLDIVSTRPLLVRPQTPRFFVIGDQVTLGSAVHNNTGQALSVDVSLAAEGLTLQGSASQSVNIPASGQVYVTWEAAVNSDARRVDLIFSAAGGGYKDASRPPAGTLDNQGIPVFRYEAPETVGTSGQMLEGGTRLEAISLPEAYAVSAGKLTIQVAPSLAAGMTDGLDYLQNPEYDSVEETVSSFLPNVITTRAYKAAGLSDPDLESQLNTEVTGALQRLYNWQKADGGWGWLQNEESDPLTSAYVVLSLIEAQDSSYQVSQKTFSQGLNYLRSQLVPLTRLDKPEDINRQAFLLYVLARGGKADVSSTVKLYDQWQGLAIYARAFLAQTLYLIDSGDPRLKTLLSDFASTAVVSATGTHWEEKTGDWWNWNTDTRTTAIVLSTLSQLDLQNPLNANAVRWLMSTRKSGHWQGTQETAWTLMALTNWMSASGELQANYKYGIALNGERLGGGTADRETLRQTYVLSVDVADLLTQEANRLVFARDSGPGNLYYTAFLDVSLPVEQIQPVDQGMTISRSYYRLDDLTHPVSEARQGDLLLARLTVVVPSAMHFLVIDDPLSAGLEAIDQSLSTSPQSVDVPQEYSWDDIFWKGWGWWWFTHVQMRDEKLVLSASYLPAGTYVYTYLVRASTIGIFRTIPPTGQEFYFPEVYGRGEGSLFTVMP
jgi:uncharacterized protein YfaS (alpha-2-macroglobulin family)